MNILLFTKHDPRNVSYGAEQRSRMLWKALQSVGNVDVVVPVFSKKLDCGLDGNVDSAAGVRFVRLYNPGYTLRGFLQRCYLRVSAMVKSFEIIALPWYDTKEFRNRILGGRRHDLVVARYTDAAALCALWKVGPLIVDIDDHPLEVCRTLYRNTCGKDPYQLSERFVRMWSAWVHGKCRCTLLASEAQRDLVKNAMVVSNASPFPPMYYSYDAEPHMRLMTVGIMGWQPNTVGVDKFINCYWSEIRRRFPLMEYHVIGKGIPHSYALKWAAVPGVVLRGYVDDLFSEYERALAVVAPVSGGGGTCIKVPEALHAHRVCFASCDALRGMPTEWCEAGLLRPIDGKMVSSIESMVSKMPSRENLDFALSDRAFTFDAAREAVCQAVRKATL